MGNYDSTDPEDQSTKGLTSVLEGTFLSGFMAKAASRKYSILIATGRLFLLFKTSAWLEPICLQLFPAMLLFTSISFMPFSPRWLAYREKEEEEARKLLAQLRGLPQEYEIVEIEFLEIKAQSLFEKRSVAELWPGLQELTWANTAKLQFVAVGSLFRTKAMFRRVFVATVTMFFQQ